MVRCWPLCIVQTIHVLNTVCSGALYASNGVIKINHFSVLIGIWNLNFGGYSITLIIC